MHPSKKISTFSDEDSALIKALLEDGMSPADVIEKFETTAYDIGINFLECDFKMKRSLFDIRARRGAISLTSECIERICQLCDESLPYTFEFWYSNKCAPDGAWHICKACEKERAFAKRPKNKKLQPKQEISHEPSSSQSGKSYQYTFQIAK